MTRFCCDLQQFPHTRTGGSEGAACYSYVNESFALGDHLTRGVRMLVGGSVGD
jgi:hypothetical protein